MNNFIKYVVDQSRHTIWQRGSTGTRTYRLTLQRTQHSGILPTRAHTYALMYARTHSRTHTCTHTQTHIHTYIHYTIRVRAQGDQGDCPQGRPLMSHSCFLLPQFHSCFLMPQFPEGTDPSQGSQGSQSGSNRDSPTPGCCF